MVTVQYWYHLTHEIMKYNRGYRHKVIQPLNFDKDTTMHTREESDFTKQCGKLSTCKITYLKSYLYTKITSKCFKDINIRPESLKILKEKIGETLQHISVGNGFLYQIPVGKEIKPTVDKCSLWTLNIFCISKETVKKVKRQFTEREKNLSQLYI